MVAGEGLESPPPAFFLRAGFPSGSICRVFR
jgi:hypothetical protein